MPNGHDINNELEFEQHISKLSDRELVEFVARSQYKTSMLCPVHHDRISKLETRRKKEIGIASGVAGAIGIALASAVEFFIRR